MVTTTMGERNDFLTGEDSKTGESDGRTIKWTGVSLWRKRNSAIGGGEGGGREGLQDVSRNNDKRLSLVGASRVPSSPSPTSSIHGGTRGPLRRGHSRMICSFGRASRIQQPPLTLIDRR